MVTGTATEVPRNSGQPPIVSVNPAWQAFAQANGGNPERTGPGVSYLDACASAPGDPVAEEVAAAIRRALAGHLPGPLTIGVPCHSPRTARWFDMLISARQDGAGQHLGATVGACRWPDQSPGPHWPKPEASRPPPSRPARPLAAVRTSCA